MTEAQAEWEKIFSPFPDGEKKLKRILEKYAEAGRYYHTLLHLTEMSNLLMEYRHETSCFSDIILATLYHDIIYDALRADNEELSALEAERDLAEAGLAGPQIQNICDLILATKKHQPTNDSQAMKFFLDADLAILGANQARYDRYAADVRKEYAHVPKGDYRAGRAAVLKKFLDRSQLYFTDRMRARFEVAARENLAREIAALEKP